MSRERIVTQCPGCEARAARQAIERSVAGRPEGASRFARVVIVAQDLAAARGADRIEGEDLERAADHVRREVSA